MMCAKCGEWATCIITPGVRECLACGHRQPLAWVALTDHLNHHTCDKECPICSPSASSPSDTSVPF